MASAKVKEGQRLQEEGKMMEGDAQAITSHAEAISYSLYAEINHFQANRQQEFKIMMQNFLEQQIEFYQRVRVVASIGLSLNTRSINYHG